MLDQVVALLNALLAQIGASHLTLGNGVMIAAGAGMIALAAARRFEPLLLVGAGFACIVANLPAAHGNTLFQYAYLGVDNLIVPSLLALGVGAMTDFGPVIANPRLLFPGAAAQLGIVVALVLAKSLGFTLQEAGAIGIIGGGDGPLALFVTAQLAPHLLGPVALAAFSFLALMSVMQERLARLLPPAGGEHAVPMAAPRKATKQEKIAFAVFIAIMFNLVFPPIAPLITMLMLGNLLREIEATGRLAKTAAGGIANVLIIVLTVAIGSTMAADKFLTVQTVEIALLGLVAFVCGIVSTLMVARLMNLSLAVGAPVNPLSPIAEPGAQTFADHEHSGSVLIQPWMRPNLAGVFGAAMLGGIMLLALGVN